MKSITHRIRTLGAFSADFLHADVIGYVIILITCFVLFQQSDLFHTTASSYAYLDGHYRDFYDYNKPLFVRNDYFPILYAIFAVWNLPLHLFGLTTDIVNQGWSALSVIEIVWAKLLLVLFFFATAIMTYKTGLLVTEGKQKQARLAAALFATAPIGIFAVFIFGQYDIIGLFFTMAGFYSYLRKDFRRFAWLFSVAISFKFFAVLLFIPLLLLAEKRLTQIAKYSAIALIVPIAQLALYWNNNAFREGIFVQASGKVDNLTGAGLSPFTILIIAYSLICLYAFIKKPRDDNEWRKVAILIPIVAYGAMFTFVVWHPQWLIILTPFFALAQLYMKNKSKFYLIEIVGMLAFVWWIVNLWPGNVDVSMLSSGPLRDFFKYIPLANADLMPIRFLPAFKILFHIYLFSPLLWLGYEKLRYNSIPDIENINNYFRARFILGVSIFVVPSLFCAFAPEAIAKKFNPVAYSKIGLVLDMSQKPVGEITKDRIVTQSFKAEQDKLCAISVKLATYARTNDSKLKIVLLSDDGAEIATQIVDGKQLLDNTFHAFRFPVIMNSKNKRFQISISSPDGKQGNAITAWMSESYNYPEGHLSVNGVTIPGDLSLKLYYE